MVTFPIVGIKYPDKLNLREKGFYFGPEFQVAVPHSLEAKYRSLRGAGLTECHQEVEGDERWCTQSTSPLYAVQEQSSENGAVLP